MLAKPGKDDYTKPASYRPIALLKTISKIYVKTLTTYLSCTVEGNELLHPGHYGGRPGRSSQDALVHLISWIKAHWKAGHVVGAVFAEVKSSFPAVNHPRMLHTLEMLGLHPELLNIVDSFRSCRQTYLSFNGEVICQPLS